MAAHHLANRLARPIAFQPARIPSPRGWRSVVGALVIGGLLGLAAIAAVELVRTVVHPMLVGGISILTHPSHFPIF